MDEREKNWSMYKKTALSLLEHFLQQKTLNNHDRHLLMAILVRLLQHYDFSVVELVDIWEDFANVKESFSHSSFVQPVEMRNTEPLLGKTPSTPRKPTDTF